MSVPQPATVAAVLVGLALGAACLPVRAAGPRPLVAVELFTPPACAAGAFDDVEDDDPECRWFQQLETDGITQGCGGNNFCPDLAVTRRQLAVMLEKAMHGTASWDAVTTATLDAMRPRFYLTPLAYPASAAATTACAAGFHMASRIELMTSGNLRYDIALGYTFDDSGSGAPVGAWGFARSGRGSSTASNCQNWTSNTAGEMGMAMYLDQTFGALWIVNFADCQDPGRVWCIEN